MSHKSYTHYVRKEASLRESIVILDSFVADYEEKKKACLRQLSPEWAAIFPTTEHREKALAGFEKFRDLQAPIILFREELKASLNSTLGTMAYIRRQEKLADQEVEPGCGLCATEAQRALYSLPYLDNGIRIAKHHSKWETSVLNMLIAYSNSPKKVFDAQIQKKKASKHELSALTNARDVKISDYEMFDEWADDSNHIVMSAYEKAYDKDYQQQLKEEDLAVAAAQAQARVEAKPLVITIDYSRNNWEKFTDGVRFFTSGKFLQVIQTITQKQKC